jgi:cell division protein FtsB
MTVLSTPLFMQSIRKVLSTSSDRGGKIGDKKSDDQGGSVSTAAETLKATQAEGQDLKKQQGSTAALNANLASPTVSPAGNPIETKNAEVPAHNQSGRTQPSSAPVPGTTTTTGVDTSHPQNQKHLSSVYAAATNTAHLIGDTLHKNVEVLYHQWYERMEGTMMKSVNESNRRRFRIYFFGSIGVIIIVSYVFGDRIRKAVSDQTADIAKETLENESLKIQTQELAMAVVQTVLNDKEITAHAASFLKEASSAAETQQALLELTLHVLQHPQCFQELMILSQKLINDLSADPVRVYGIYLFFNKPVNIFAGSNCQDRRVGHSCI